MKKIIWPLVGLFFILIYISTPQYTATKFWDYMSSEEYERAEALTVGEVFDFTSFSELDSAFFSRTTFIVREVGVETEEAVVRGAIRMPSISHALDLPTEIGESIEKAPIIQKECTIVLQRNNGWKIADIKFGGE